MFVAAMAVDGHLACSRSQNGDAVSVRDCADCPEVIAIPAGDFTMGSPMPELYRRVEDQHRAVIQMPRLVGKYEITLDQ